MVQKWGQVLDGGDWQNFRRMGDPSHHPPPKKTPALIVWGAGAFIREYMYVVLQNEKHLVFLIKLYDRWLVAVSSPSILLSLITHSDILKCLYNIYYTEFTLMLSLFPQIIHHVSCLLTTTSEANIC